MRANRAAICLTIALAGCTPVPEDAGLRQPNAVIASSTAFDPARFSDVWHIVAAYGGEAGCGPLAETWQPVAPGRFRITGTRCGPSGARAFVTEARVTGPGRITRGGAAGDEVLWVLWVDADYRVAVIGSPSGGFGRVLARRPVLRDDLMQAAEDVLRFNGYDPAAMKLL